MTILGIDVSTRSLALAEIIPYDLGPEFRAEELWSYGDTFDARLTEITGRFYNFLLERHEKITIAYVEDIPYVRQQNGLRIAQMLGVTKAMLTQFNVPYLPVNISTWKKGTVGHGNAQKHQVKAWVDTEWGIIRPLASQNLYDAIAIASYGVKHENESRQEAAKADSSSS